MNSCHFRRCLHSSVNSPSHTKTIPPHSGRQTFCQRFSAPAARSGRVKGQGSGDDNMAAVISSPSSATVQSGTKEKLHFLSPPPRGAVTRVWREALLANHRAAEAWQHYLLWPCCFLYSWQTTRGCRERHEQATHRPHPDTELRWCVRREWREAQRAEEEGIDQPHWKLRAACESCHKEFAGWIRFVRWEKDDVRKEWEAAPCRCVYLRFVIQGPAALFVCIFGQGAGVPCIPRLWAAALHSGTFPSRCAPTPTPTPTEDKRLRVLRT